MKRPGPIATSVIAWTLGAAVSVGVGLLALSLIGVGLTTNSGEHLTQPVGRADPPDLTIASPPPGVPAATPSAAPPSSATVGPNRTIDTAGGNWSPAASRAGPTSSTGARLPVTGPTTSIAARPPWPGSPSRAAVGRSRSA